ncbi:MAG: TetR/AcrR family transcriptional regulator [Sandaracinaceae bacterium]|nr:TetR/AcrR family transcriptional regulator [Sandaracinaceae bacterium]
MSEDTEESARAASARETRNKLVRAAAALFAEQGLTKPSLDAICARAGFTRGAFYVHFQTRDDLIVAVVEEVMGGFIDAIIAGGEAGAELPMIVSTFTFAVESGSFPFPGSVRPHQILEACSRSDKLRGKYVELLANARDRLAETVRRGQAGGTIREDADPQAVAQLLLATVLGVEVATELDVPYDARGVGNLLLAMLARPA